MSAIIDISNHVLMITAFVFVMMLVIEYLNVLTSGQWQEHVAGKALQTVSSSQLSGRTAGLPQTIHSGDHVLSPDPANWACSMTAINRLLLPEILF